MRGTKTATVLVMVGTGSKYENKNNNGISHFLEHMFFKGTKKRPNTHAITSELDKVGGEYNAFTGKEYTGYWVKVESGQIELAMDVVSDMLLNSKFSQAEINREKGVIVEEFNMYRDNPMMYIEDLFEQCLYGDTPAGWDTIGTKKNIENFQRQNFVDYLKSQYGSDNTIVCLAGDINESDTALVSKYFSSFKPAKSSDKLPVQENQILAKSLLHFKKTDQAHLSLGVRAYPYAHPDEMALKIISILLGGSMSSRLFIRLRERHGLAYYVRTGYETYTDSGYLSTQAGVPTNKLDEAIKIILVEYKRLAKEGLTAAELGKVKQCLIGRSALQFELSDNMANWYARQATMLKITGKERGILTPEHYFKEINRVTADDIKRVARDIFVEHKLNLAVIGNFKDKKRFENILHL